MATVVFLLQTEKMPNFTFSFKMREKKEEVVVKMRCAVKPLKSGGGGFRDFFLRSGAIGSDKAKRQRPLASCHLGAAAVVLVELSQVTSCRPSNSRGLCSHLRVGPTLPRPLWVLSLSRCFNERYVTSRCSRAPRPAPVAPLYCSLSPSAAGTLTEGKLRKEQRTDLWQYNGGGQAGK